MTELTAQRHEELLRILKRIASDADDLQGATHTPETVKDVADDIERAARRAIALLERG